VSVLALFTCVFDADDSGRLSRNAAVGRLYAEPRTCRRDLPFVRIVGRKKSLRRRARCKPTSSRPRHSAASAKTFASMSNRRFGKLLPFSRFHCSFPWMSSGESHESIFAGTGVILTTEGSRRALCVSVKIMPGSIRERTARAIPRPCSELSV